jgi:hypothetical protein
LTFDQLVAVVARHATAGQLSRLAMAASLLHAVSVARTQAYSHYVLSSSHPISKTQLFSISL